MTPLEIGITVPLAIVYLIGGGFFYVLFLKWRQGICHQKQGRSYCYHEHEAAAFFITLTWPIISWSMLGGYLAVLYQEWKKNAATA